MVKFLALILHVSAHSLEIVDPFVVGIFFKLAVIKVKDDQVVIHIAGANGNLLVTSWAVGSIGSQADRAGKDVAAIMVGVFADNVDPAWRKEAVGGCLLEDLLKICF